MSKARTVGKITLAVRAPRVRALRAYGQERPVVWIPRIPEAEVTRERVTIARKQRNN